jgi:monofunctional biosynthetic peptidoglycan transglycosylase
MTALLVVGTAAAVGELYLLSRLRQLESENPARTLWMNRRRARSNAAKCRQLFVPLDKVPSHLQWAVILSEDAGFYDHRGIDLGEMKESLLRNVREGRVVRGGSTITMQTARLLFLWPGRGLGRKVLELLITPQMEAMLTKRRILELYLNYVEWGDALFGCQAASIEYYSKPCWRLSAAESALLAACLPNPGKRNPARPSRLVLWSQQRILGMLERKGVLGQ